MPFDVGAITRELQTDFRLFAPPNREGVVNESAANRATPENLAALVGALERLTAEIETQRASQINGWLPDVGVVLWDGAFAQWKARLQGYRSAVDAAPKGDRQAVLWNVTAPLLLGFYGGPDSSLPRQPLDASTPFSLSNQLAVAADWQAERWRIFKQDVAKAAGSIIGGGGLVLAAALVVGLLLFRGRR